MVARVIAFPGVTVSPWPVCGYGIRSDEFHENPRCARCQLDIHAPCFRRTLPLEEWVAFLRWVDDKSRLDDSRALICAACRQLEGPGG
jgi:hypothetical protein